MATISYFRVTLVMAVAVLVVVVAGYGPALAQGAQGGGCGEPPTEPPPGVFGVTTFTPGFCATDVDPGITIKANFSKKLDKSTVNEQTVSVSEVPPDDVPNPEPPPPVPAEVKAKKKKVTLNPTFELDPNTEYEVTIEGGEDGVKSKKGKELSGDFTWTFTTGSS